MGVILAQTNNPVLEAAEREAHTEPKLNAGGIPPLTAYLFDTEEGGHEVVIGTTGAGFKIPLPANDDLGKHPALIGIGADDGAIVAYLIGNRNRAFVFDTGLRVGNDAVGTPEDTHEMVRGVLLEAEAAPKPEDFRAMVREEVAEGIRAITDNHAQLAHLLTAAPPAAPLDATMIAAQVANAILLGPPADDHYGLPANARFNTRLQETIAIMFVNQAFWQEVAKAVDQALAGLRIGGYQPPR